jgi:hypothetical protein
LKDNAATKSAVTHLSMALLDAVTFDFFHQRGAIQLQ